MHVRSVAAFLFSGWCPVYSYWQQAKSKTNPEACTAHLAALSLPSHLQMYPLLSWLQRCWSETAIRLQYCVSRADQAHAGVTQTYGHVQAKEPTNQPYMEWTTWYHDFRDVHIKSSSFAPPKEWGFASLAPITVLSSLGAATPHYWLGTSDCLFSHPKQRWKSSHWFWVNRADDYLQTLYNAYTQ